MSNSGSRASRDGTASIAARIAIAMVPPLIAGWSIWVGIAISSRTTDVRAAQQLSVFASLPPLAIVALMSLKVIRPSTGLALALAAVLLAVDALAWRAVATIFDRERLVTGRRR
jgi:ABC-2 type transport system permease protein